MAKKVDARWTPISVYRVGTSEYARATGTIRGEGGDGVIAGRGGLPALNWKGDPER